MDWVKIGTATRQKVCSFVILYFQFDRRGYRVVVSRPAWHSGGMGSILCRDGMVYLMSEPGS